MELELQIGVCPRAPDKMVNGRQPDRKIGGTGWLQRKTSHVTTRK